MVNTLSVVCVNQEVNQQHFCADGAKSNFGRKKESNPAQAATIFRSAQKKIPHLGAEQGGRRFRAGMAEFSSAGGYIFSFRAGMAANICAGS